MGGCLQRGTINEVVFECASEICARCHLGRNFGIRASWNYSLFQWMAIDGGFVCANVFSWYYDAF